jgi:hypothetical protein
MVRGGLDVVVLAFSGTAFDGQQAAAVDVGFGVGERRAGSM